MLFNQISKRNSLRRQNLVNAKVSSTQLSHMTCFAQLHRIRVPMRQMRGSGMLEGAVGLMLVTSGLIFAALILLNSGAAIYNQMKLGFVAHSAAVFAAQDTSGSRQSDVSSQVSTMMSNVGLSSANTTTTITDTTIGSMPAVSLKISANLPTLLSASFGGVLPQQIQINETAVALKPYNPMQYIWVNPPVGQGCVVPLLQPNGNYPNDGLPVWLVSLAGIRQIRN